MTDGTKQGDKAKADNAPKPAAPEQKQAPAETRHLREVHLANAKAAYGEGTALVAAGLSVLDARKSYPEGYTKSEVKAAIASAKSTEIKEG